MKYLLLLLLPIIANATTRVKATAQPSIKICEMRASFTNVEVARESYVRKGREHSLDSVFWKLNILEVSDKNLCPNLGEQKIRVRGADFSGDIKNPEIRYAVDLEQPNLNELISLKVTLVKGVNSLTQKKYEEWILVGKEN